MLLPKRQTHSPSGAGGLILVARGVLCAWIQNGHVRSERPSLWGVRLDQGRECGATNARSLPSFLPDQPCRLGRRAF
jgi:hypothetical protein